MRVSKIVLLLVLIVSLSGCAQETSSPKIQEPVNTSEDTIKEEVEKPNEIIASQQYNTILVVIKKSGEKWLVVDERGLVHKLGASEIDSTVEPGSVFTAGRVSINSSGEYQVKLESSYYIGYMQLMTASNDDAPYSYATLILDNYVAGGDPAYAISEYVLKDVEIKQAYNTGRIDAVMTFDVKNI